MNETREAFVSAELGDVWRQPKRMREWIGHRLEPRPVDPDRTVVAGVLLSKLVGERERGPARRQHVNRCEPGQRVRKMNRIDRPVLDRRVGTYHDDWMPSALLCQEQHEVGNILWLDPYRIDQDRMNADVSISTRDQRTDQARCTKLKPRRQ